MGVVYSIFSGFNDVLASLQKGITRDYKGLRPRGEILYTNETKISKKPPPKRLKVFRSSGALEPPSAGMLGL